MTTIFPDPCPSDDQTQDAEKEEQDVETEILFALCNAYRIAASGEQWPHGELALICLMDDVGEEQTPPEQ